MFGTRSFVKVAAMAGGIMFGFTASASAQLVENLDGVTADGPVTVLEGSGDVDLDGWNDGISGEHAYVGTVGTTKLTATAEGVPGGGVTGGGGRIEISDVTFNFIDQDFDQASGAGSTSAGDDTAVADPCLPRPPATIFFDNWADGVSGEYAYFGTCDGALLPAAGAFTAVANPTGGMGGSGGGSVDVDGVTLSGGDWFAGAFIDVTPFPGAAAMLNPQFDQNLAELGGWETYNVTGANPSNVQANADPILEPLSGTAALGLFGAFTDPGATSGAFQRVTAEPGQTWELDCYSKHISGDTMGATSLVVMRIEFLDDTETIILEDEATILTAGSALDTWIDNTPLQLTAPIGTVEVRPVFEFVHTDETEAGAGYIENARFRIVGGNSPVDVSDYSVTADIRGVVDGGETLGGYQLRLEDPDGNRLVFSGTATGTYASAGGNLGTFAEQDALGIPVAGEFNENAGFYRLVIAFDNAASAWGTGGTIEFDNLLSPSPDPGANAWFAGAFWPGVTVPVGSEDDVVLSAHIKGDSGAAYELRAECFRLVEAGVDDDFNAVDGLGGNYTEDLPEPAGMFLSYDDFSGTCAGGTNNGSSCIDDGDCTGGGTCDGDTRFVFNNNWDDGVSGEGAFGGLFGDAQIFDLGGNSGFIARGTVGGGDDSLGGGEIRVEDVGQGPGGGWFAGLTWADQGVASTNLNAVNLEAKVRGTLTSGFTFGTYELRIEDCQGDRLFFEETADGTWQTVGGTLDTATEGAALSGGGNGTFDMDCPPFAVTIAFTNETTTWEFGGALEVDDVFLTAFDFPVEIGRASFPGTADGTFQLVGGPLATAITNFGDYENDLNDVDGSNIGVTRPPNMADAGFDDGTDLETAFFGSCCGAAGGLAEIYGCIDCAQDGSGAAVLDVSGVGGGIWWAGMFWKPIAADLSADPSAITLTADIKAEWDDGDGQTPGEFFIRLEDKLADGAAPNNVLSMTYTADGTWQSVGGPLTGFQLETLDGGDGNFKYGQGQYTVTVGFVGSGPWGTGGTITVDNLFLTGPELTDADDCSVVIAMEDGVGSWGTSGTLEFDNVNFAVQTTPTCTGVDAKPCVDTDNDNIIDDICTWGECVADLCNVLTRVVPADMGGAFGACQIDTFCNIHDRTHALTCFAGTNACQPINIDAGGAFGACGQDGFCNIHDANHALTCFAGTNPCVCGPAPEFGGPDVVGQVDIELVAGQRSVRAGDTVDVRVFVSDAAQLQSYQLHLEATGGKQGHLELIDIAIESRKDFAFGRDATFDAVNVDKAQMLSGLDFGGNGINGRGYLATFTYAVSDDASGDFVIDLMSDPSAGHQTYMISDFVDAVGINAVQPAVLRVGSATRNR
jgi:hypothetical protein